MKFRLNESRGVLKGVIGIFAFGLVGCQSVEPKDLRLESVRIVRLADVPDAWPWAQRRSDTQQEKIMLLNVGFSSKTDIVKFAKKKSFHISYIAGLCSAGTDIVASEEVFSIPYLRVGDKNLESGLGYVHQNLEAARRKDGRLLYEVFVPVADAELKRVYGKGLSIAGKRAVPLFDYFTTRKDLCIQLVGGAMWSGGSFSSNVIRIPHETVVRLAEPGADKSIRTGQ